jgi:hypothetical protein
VIALRTTHEAWRELVEAYEFSWDQAESWLAEALGRAILTPRAMASRSRRR